MAKTKLLRAGKGGKGARRKTQQFEHEAAAMPSSDVHWHAGTGWRLDVTPEVRALAMAAVDRTPPCFAPSGSELRAGAHESLDMPLTDDMYAKIASHDHPNGVSISIIDARSNLPLESPVGVKVVIVETGTDVGWINGTFLISGNFTFRLSAAGGPTYELTSARVFRVSKVED